MSHDDVEWLNAALVAVNPSHEPRQPILPRESGQQARAPILREGPSR